MFFTEIRGLNVPLTSARDRLHTHPHLEQALRTASAAAFGDGLRSTFTADGANPAVPTPEITAFTLAPYRRGDTSVVAVRWLMTAPSVKHGQPVLDANLELRPDHDPGACLVLLGSYQPAAAFDVDIDHAASSNALQISARSFLRRTAILLNTPSRA